MDIGIMQGRLCVPESDFIQVFPIENWQQEFSAARDAGLVSIEWIYDTYGLGRQSLGDPCRSRRNNKALLGPWHRREIDLRGLLHG